MTQGCDDAGMLEQHGRPHHITLTLPPLGAIFLKSEAPGQESAVEAGVAELGETAIEGT